MPTDSTIEAMVRLGAQYMTDHPGWGHYDSCPAARGDHPENDDCICDKLAAEYEDERHA